jgi:predicted deacylase
VIVDTFSRELPVNETFRIQKNRHMPQKDISDPRRISIVTGTHGDELEGQYVCFLLNEWLNNNREKIRGIIDIYPALNSLGIDSITRTIPFFNVDLNRTFPGNKKDYIPAQIADGIVEEIAGSDIAIDIHSSNMFLKEIPQIRMSQEYAPSLLPLAKKMGIDFVWIHDAVTVLEATFAHALNMRGTKTLVVEMGVGMRLTQAYCGPLVEGIINLLASEGLIEYEIKVQKEPIISDHGEVFFLNAEAAGTFVTNLNHEEMVKKGDLIGRVVSPLTGEVLENVYSPVDGLLFTLREYPVVYEGSLLARIFEDKS